jgi:hypothetical protein
MPVRKLEMSEWCPIEHTDTSNKRKRLAVGAKVHNHRCRISEAVDDTHAPVVRVHWRATQPQLTR